MSEKEVKKLTEWTPAHVPGLVYWWDAELGQVWPDKSGNEHHFRVSEHVEAVHMHEGPLTKEQREDIEGYLAEKWMGLHVLPVNHRYSPWAGSPWIVKLAVRAYRRVKQLWRTLTMMNWLWEKARRRSW